MEKKQILAACNGCGMCCRAIPMSKSLSEIKEIASNGLNSDAKFIVDNWEEITYDDAVKINPSIARKPASINRKRNRNYFSCTQIKDDNTCGIYESRPNICKSYPYRSGRYGTGGIDIDTLISPDTCGYAAIASSMDNCLATAGEVELPEVVSYSNLVSEIMREFTVQAVAVNYRLDTFDDTYKLVTNWFLGDSDEDGNINTKEAHTDRELQLLLERINLFDKVTMQQNIHKALAKIG